MGFASSYCLNRRQGIMKQSFSEAVFERRKREPKLQQTGFPGTGYVPET